jgi:predicted transcriptional regulator
MPKAKIKDNKLLELVDEGLTLSKIGAYFGVTKAAVSKRLKMLRGRTTRAVISKRVDEVVDRKLDAMDQLQKINNYANELLDLLIAWNRGDDVAIQILEKQIKKIRTEDGEFEIDQVKFKDPRELAVKVMAEIRGQLKLQLEIFQALYDLKAAEEFQATVLEILAEVDPNLRNEVIRRLNERRSVRQAVRFN